MQLTRREAAALVRQSLMTGVGLTAGVTALGWPTAPAGEAAETLDPASVDVWLGVGAIAALAAAGIDVLRSRRR